MNYSPDVMRRLILALFFSVLLHWLTGYGLGHLPPSALLSQIEKDQNRVEVTIQEQPKRKDEKLEKGQVVLQALVPEQYLTENDDPTNLLSERRQRVKREMVAAQSGLTENRSAPVVPPSSLQQRREHKLDLFHPPSIQKKSQETAKSEGQLGDGPGRPPSPHIAGATTSKAQRQGESSSAPSLDQKFIELSRSGISTFNESLPQAQIGEITALNADAYLFYSFYSRLVPQIRFHWERNVGAAIDQATATAMNLPRKTEWTTMATVILDREGQYVDTQIERSSGLKLLDDAAVYAFKSGAPFRNPPLEMIQDDGRIHVKMGFTVHWRPVIVSRPQAPASALPTPAFPSNKM